VGVPHRARARRGGSRRSHRWRDWGGTRTPNPLIKREQNSSSSALCQHLCQHAGLSGRANPQELPPVHATNHATRASRRFRGSSPVTKAREIIYGQANIVKELRSVPWARFGLRCASPSREQPPQHGSALRPKLAAQPRSPEFSVGLLPLATRVARVAVREFGPAQRQLGDRRKLKDPSGQPVVGSDGNGFIGAPVVDPVMPAMANLAESIACGDWCRYFLRIAEGVRYELSEESVSTTTSGACRAIIRLTEALGDVTRSGPSPNATLIGVNGAHRPDPDRHRQWRLRTADGWPGEPAGRRGGEARPGRAAEPVPA
jgi:hypothetical protein